MLVSLGLSGISCHFGVVVGGPVCFLYLSPAFALVDDLQRILPSRGELHALPHHRKVSVP